MVTLRGNHHLSPAAQLRRSEGRLHKLAPDPATLCIRRNREKFDPHDFTRSREADETFTIARDEHLALLHAAIQPPRVEFVYAVRWESRIASETSLRKTRSGQRAQPSVLSRDGWVNVGGTLQVAGLRHEVDPLVQLEPRVTPRDGRLSFVGEQVQARDAMLARPGGEELGGFVRCQRAVVDACHTKAEETGVPAQDINWHVRGRYAQERDPPEWVASATR